MTMPDDLSSAEDNVSLVRCLSCSLGGRIILAVERSGIRACSRYSLGLLDFFLCGGGISSTTGGGTGGLMIESTLLVLSNDFRKSTSFGFGSSSIL